VVTGNYNNSRVFNFANLLKSRKFDACNVLQYLCYVNAYTEDTLSWGLMGPDLTAG